MAEARAAEVAELVKSALEREPGEWPTFLDETCRDNTELRAEVESLLGFQARARDFIERPAVHLAAEMLGDDDILKAGERLGQYEIESLIGSGGMGVVYLAKDTELGRKVALKLVRQGFGTRNLARHLRQEERILAAFDHPNIARLYGGAVTAEGVPYFIMEYIEGRRLDAYCDEENLTTNERLSLFRKVCSAVTYAHQHLVIHRDLKPANIRVTPEGEPKLLDFGIAKLLDPDATQGLEQTMTLASVMTPDYASPEQVRGESMTTASDVYSLGVVLYELLTGERPYRTNSRNPNEIARAITDQEPTRPSTAIGNQKSEIRNHKFLRGDLDNILLMALRKEPARRYASVGQFSEDIRRHLAGMPVTARKDTWSYRSAKFVQRNRVGVAAAGLVLLTLVCGIIATLWEARAARHEKAKAESINAFLKQMIDYTNPYLDLPRAHRRDMTVSEALDHAAQRLEKGDLASEPEVRADLEGIISGAYMGQGKRTQSREHAEKFVAMQTSLYGRNDPRNVAAVGNQAWLAFEKGEMTESERLFRDVLPRQRVEQRRGEIPAEWLMGSLTTFGQLRRTQGDSREAEFLFREALALKPLIRKEEAAAVTETRSTLASTLADQGKFEEGLTTAREAVSEARAAEQSDNPILGFALTIFGGFLTDKGDFAEADSALREGEKIFRDLIDPQALWLGDNLRNQAISFYKQDRFAEAQPKNDEALKIYQEGFGPHYDHYPTVLITQGLLWNKTGKTKEAEAVLREAVKLRTELLPKDHYWVAIAKGALGECLTTQGRFAEAESLLVESQTTLAARLGPNDPRAREASRRLEALYDSRHK